jgi:DNA-binding MarR family transcriptional regulator
MNSEELLAKHFLQTIPDAMRIIRTQIRQLAKTELTVPQLRILALLSEENQQHPTNSTLAELLGMSAPCASRMVDYLVKQGLIKRVRNCRDRREVNLKLTPKGVTKFNSIKLKAQEHFNQQFDKLSSERRLALKNGLEVIDQIFRE